MDELEQKISREIMILNDERQYMKKLAEDVETGKFGGRVSTPPTSTGNVGTADTGEMKIETLKVAPVNYDNAILVIRFDDTNFDYSNALFESISNALEQMPSANFEVVAVSPTGGASFSDKARQRASKFLAKL